MAVPYIQKSFYWIPRIWGQDPFTGTYANFPPGGTKLWSIICWRSSRTTLVIG